MAPPLHRLVEMPAGKSIADLNPLFKDISCIARIGAPSPECGGCRKPFNAVRKPRKALRLWPTDTLIPFAVDVRLCGVCLALYRAGGDKRDGLLVAIEAYIDGDEADQ